MGFIMAHLGTIIVGAVVALILILIILRQIRRKSGSCGCDCSGCPNSGLCGEDSENKS